MAINLETILEEMLEFSKHLPSGKNIPEEMLILKGHMLIERQLMALIECKAKKPEVLKASRFTFVNKLHLAHALYGELPSIDWGHIREVNSIRNSMAHELENEMVAPRLKRFIQAVGDNDLKYVEGGLLEQLAYCLSHIHLELVKAREI